MSLLWDEKGSSTTENPTRPLGLVDTKVIDAEKFADISQQRFLKDYSSLLQVKKAKNFRNFLIELIGALGYLFISECKGLLAKDKINDFPELKEKIEPRIQKLHEEYARANYSTIIGYFNLWFSQTIENIRNKALELWRLNLISPTYEWQSVWSESLGALPEGAKYVFSDSSKVVYVISQNPQVRTVKFKPHSFDLRITGGKFDYQLAFPYVIFVVVLQKSKNSYPSLYAFQSVYPIKSLDMPIYSLMMPNIQNEGLPKVCLNAYAPSDSLKYAAKAEDMVKRFWEGTFTNVNFLHQHFAALINSGYPFDTLANWEKESLKNSLFVLKHKTMISPPVRKTTLRVTLDKLFAQSMAETDKVNLRFAEELEKLLTYDSDLIKKNIAEVISKNQSNQAIKDNFHVSLLDLLGLSFMILANKFFKKLALEVGDLPSKSIDDWRKFFSGYEKRK